MEIAYSSLEIWKTIKNHEKYEVSNLGNIRRKIEYIKIWNKRLNKEIIKYKNPILVGKKLSQKGYKRVRLDGKTYFVHRVVAENFIINNNPQIKTQINHIDCDKLNNSIYNLEWCTNLENRKHAVKNKLHASRENTGLGKISRNDVKYISKLYNSGMLQKDIAEVYKVRQQTISKLLKDFWESENGRKF